MGFARSRISGFLWAVLPLLVAGLLVILSLWFVVWGEGWPVSHDALAWKDRTMVFALHFQQGDLWPVWSSRDAVGYGSPFPLYYHRVQTSLSAGLYLLTGSMQSATWLSLAAVAWFGVVGLYLSLRRFALERWVAWTLAACLPFLNYVGVQLWLRGALAEYTALCLVPWVWHWGLHGLRGSQGRGILWGLWGAGVLGLIYHSHSLIFFLCAVPVGLVFVFRLVAEGWRAVLPAAAMLAGALAVVLLPNLVLQWQYNAYIDFDRGFGAFVPWESYRPLLEYLFSGSGHVWGRIAYPEHGVAVQLDWAFLGAAAGLMGMLGWSRLRQRGRSLSPPRTACLTAWWFLLMVLWFAFLQAPASAWVHQHFPGFRYLQFPWRTLAVLASLQIVLLGWLLAGRGQRLPRLVAPLVLIVTVGLSPVWHGGGKRYPKAEVEGKFWAGIPINTGGTREFLPRMAAVPEGADSLRYLWDTFEPKPWVYDWTGVGYKAWLTWPENAEALDRDCHIQATSAVEVALPMAWTPWVRVIRREDGSVVATWRTAEDPRIHLRLEAGNHPLQVQFPTVRRMVDQWLAGETRLQLLHNKYP